MARLRKLCRVLVSVLQAWGGPVGAGAGWGVDGCREHAREEGMVARLKKWRRVYPEFGHDGPEK